MRRVIVVGGRLWGWRTWLAWLVKVRRRVEQMRNLKYRRRGKLQLTLSNLPPSLAFNHHYRNRFLSLSSPSHWNTQGERKERQTRWTKTARTSFSTQLNRITFL